MTPRLLAKHLFCERSRALSTAPQCVSRGSNFLSCISWALLGLAVHYSTRSEAGCRFRRTRKTCWSLPESFRCCPFCVQVVGYLISFVSIILQLCPWLSGSRFVTSCALKQNRNLHLGHSKLNRLGLGPAGWVRPFTWCGLLARRTGNAFLGSHFQGDCQNWLHVLGV